MNLELDWRTELEKQRDAYFAERAKPGMTIDEVMQLNDEVFRRFPITLEERQRKFESLKAIPEFVL
jgi:hypothetical protein